MTMEGNRVTGVVTKLNMARVTVIGVPDCPGIAADLFESLAEADINVDAIVQNVSAEGTTDWSFTVRSKNLDHALATAQSIIHTIGAREVLSQDGLAQVSIVGVGMLNSPGYAARMFRALADAGINIEMIITSEIRITCIVRLDDAEKAVQALLKVFRLELAAP